MFVRATHRVDIAESAQSPLTSLPLILQFPSIPPSLTLGELARQQYSYQIPDLELQASATAKSLLCGLVAQQTNSRQTVSTWTKGMEAVAHILRCKARPTRRCAGDSKGKSGRDREPRFPPPQQANALRSKLEAMHTPHSPSCHRSVPIGLQPARCALLLPSRDTHPFPQSARHAALDVSLAAPQLGLIRRRHSLPYPQETLHSIFFKISENLAIVKAKSPFCTFAPTPASSAHACTCPKVPFAPLRISPIAPSGALWVLVHLVIAGEGSPLHSHELRQGKAVFLSVCSLSAMQGHQPARCALLLPSRDTHPFPQSSRRAALDVSPAAPQLDLSRRRHNLYNSKLICLKRIKQHAIGKAKGNKSKDEGKWASRCINLAQASDRPGFWVELSRIFIRVKIRPNKVEYS
ncbi:hypothetical protein GOP47_0014937 [Adiantum capillus-veneris]|uniref:Uncharacterized protein n=1 Tax=Adiantum capillus-veneris TaxID=13818 RepID=A0A9D4UMG5_ADICA|nr:hypothetical protein GOP47_0014937 [Adiantum capillus-veneris]